MAYRTDITWDDDWPSLLFQERDRPDKPFLHRGRLYIPASSMYIHLVSLTKGAMRMVMVSQLDPAGHMRGLITTLNKQRASFVPVSAPIVYLKRDDFAGVALGELAAGHPSYRGYRAACWTKPWSRATRAWSVPSHKCGDRCRSAHLQLPKNRPASGSGCHTTAIQRRKFVSPRAKRLYGSRRLAWTPGTELSAPRPAS